MHQIPTTGMLCRHFSIVLKAISNCLPLNVIRCECQVEKNAMACITIARVHIMRHACGVPHQLYICMHTEDGWMGPCKTSTP